MDVTGDGGVWFYETFHDRVLAFFRCRLNDASAAEDLTSEVFLKVLRTLDSYDAEKASPATWIFAISRNTLTDYYRTRRIYAELPEELQSPDSPEEQLLDEAELDQLADALSSLDERRRDLIILHYSSGLSLSEAAARMGISYSYAKVLHRQALSALKKFF